LSDSSIVHNPLPFANFIADQVVVAAAAPTFLTGPIVGALADKWGAEWIIAPSLVLTLPWLPLMLLTGSLPGFIIFFALASSFLALKHGNKLEKLTRQICS
jgi:hypothetical protein